MFATSPGQTIEIKKNPAPRSGFPGVFFPYDVGMIQRVNILLDRFPISGNPGKNKPPSMAEKKGFLLHKYPAYYQPVVSPGHRQGCTVYPKIVGHKDIKTILGYTHVTTRSLGVIESPLHQLKLGDRFNKNPQ